VAALTGLRFVCLTRVTAGSWTTCAVIDSVADDGRYRDHLTPRIYGFQVIFRYRCSAPTAPISAPCAGSTRYPKNYPRTR